MELTPTNPITLKPQSLKSAAQVLYLFPASWPTLLRSTACFDTLLCAIDSRFSQHPKDIYCRNLKRCSGVWGHSSVTFINTFFSGKFIPTHPPRNANNIEPYIFPMFFYAKFDTRSSPLHYVTREWPLFGTFLNCVFKLIALHCMVMS